MDLNEAYELYRTTRDSGLPTVECIDKLYPLVRSKVKGVVGKLFMRVPDEDLVVTGTTDVLMDLDMFKPGVAQFSTWIENIVRCNCIDEMRKDESGRRPHRTPAPDDNTVLAFQDFAFDKSLVDTRALETSAQDVDGVLLELYDRIETVLDDEDQEILRLRQAGFTSQEIADRLGIPSGTLRWKVNQITNKLRVSRG